MKMEAEAGVTSQQAQEHPGLPLSAPSSLLGMEQIHSLSPQEATNPTEILILDFEALEL